MTSRANIRFLLNGEIVEPQELAADETLLDYLRLERRLRGSKEGCAEGDCGACTVLVGRLRNGALRYETINACICFTASLDGAHVVTVEHLKSISGALHPVQQAMVDFHGSQCGFCTPGFVMSIYALWMENTSPNKNDVEVALQGNLCRCTGYAPIVRAGVARADYWQDATDPLQTERAFIVETLTKFVDGTGVDTTKDGGGFALPTSVDGLAAILARRPNSRIVAGGTDVGLWVTKFMRDLGPVVFTGHLNDFREITVEENGVRFGGGATYSEALATIDQYFPQMSGFWRRIGGQQVRNAGTIGGNIANGSPIGDTPPAMIALGAKIVLRKGDARRELLLEDFFIDYGKQDRADGEFVAEIFVPFVAAGNHFAVHKISKRRDEDISSVCGSFNIAVSDGIVTDVRIAFGGMAATPKRAVAVEQMLRGQAWSLATIEDAQLAFETDYQPISDMRASASYRAITAKNLLMRFYLESVGEGETLGREVTA